MHTLLIFSLSIFFLILISKNVHQLVSTSIFYIVSLVWYMLILSVLPEGFASDQYEYFDFVKNNAFDIEDASIKYLVMFYFMYIPINIFDFGIADAKYFLFSIMILSLLYFLLRIHLLSAFLPILFLLPSVFLHAGLLLREPIVYIIIPLLTYSVFNHKKYLAFILLLSVGIVRPETALILSPIFISFFTKQYNRQVFMSATLIIVFLYIMTTPPIEIILDGYRELFNVQKFYISLSSISYSIKNLLFGSFSLDVANIILILESCLVFLLIYLIKARLLLIVSYLMAAFLIGSISDNSGFIIRLRSPVIMVTIFWYVFEQYNYKFKKK